MNFQPAVESRIQAFDDCLVLIFPSGLDSRALNEFRDSVLSVVHAGEVKRLVANLTAIDVIDSGLVSFIDEFLGTLRVLGCKTAIAGIQPQCAAAMIRMRLSFGKDVRTVLSVDEAMKLLQNEPNAHDGR